MAKKLKLLIVDDNERLCKNLSDILKLKDYDVVGVYDGHQAIEAAKSHKFDIVLLDIKMPGLNGVDTLENLKKMASDATIVMMTAFADDTYYKERLKNSNCKIIQKPIDIDKLCELLENINC